MIPGDLIFFREGFLPKETLVLTSLEWAHVKARRLDRVECSLEIRDGKGKSFLYQYSPNKKELKLQEELILLPKKGFYSIAIALPKGNRLDFFLQKATEIGLSKIYFCEFEHSVRKDFNIERAAKIVMEAASQSQQPDLMSLEIFSFDVLLKKEKENLLVLDPHAELGFQISDLIGKIPLIGPEGGFSKSETEKMEEAKLKRVKWSGGILRTETAGMVAASLLAYGI